MNVRNRLTQRRYSVAHFLLAAALALALTRTARADPGIIYVDADATGASTGLSWTDAFTQVQTALAVVNTGRRGLGGGGGVLARL